MFRRHGTTVNPHTPGKTASVVTTDIYARTRNPMYLALGLLLVAWTVFLDNLAAGLGVLVFIVYMSRRSVCLPRSSAQLTTTTAARCAAGSSC